MARDLSLNQLELTYFYIAFQKIKGSKSTTRDIELLSYSVKCLLNKNYVAPEAFLARFSVVGSFNKTYNSWLSKQERTDFLSFSIQEVNSQFNILLNEKQGPPRSCKSDDFSNSNTKTLLSDQKIKSNFSIFPIDITNISNTPIAMDNNSNNPTIALFNQLNNSNPYYSSSCPFTLKKRGKSMYDI